MGAKKETYYFCEIKEPLGKHYFYVFRLVDKTQKGLSNKEKIDSVANYLEKYVIKSKKARYKITKAGETLEEYGAFVDQLPAGYIKGEDLYSVCLDLNSNQEPQP